MKGSRIHGIVRELGNENIDVINYTTNNQLYITRALSPAKVSSIKINEDQKSRSFLEVGRGFKSHWPRRTQHQTRRIINRL
jgi:N utilization substance protein A